MIKRMTAPLLALAAAALMGCAALGVGMDEKPATPQEVFLAAASDYAGVAQELTITIDGWTAAIEAGDPLAPKYLKAVEIIEKLKAQAQPALQSGALALAAVPADTDALLAAAQVVEAVVAQLQAQLLAPGSPLVED